MGKDLQPPKDADWYACPSCGAEVRVGSRGCSRCGPGLPEDWLEEEHLEGISLPDDPAEFDYDEYVKREFGAASRVKPPHLAWKWWIVGVLLLAAMAGGAVLALWR